MGGQTLLFGNFILNIGRYEMTIDKVDVVIVITGLGAKGDQNFGHMFEDPADKLALLKFTLDRAQKKTEEKIKTKI